VISSNPFQIVFTIRNDPLAVTGSKLTTLLKKVANGWFY
jgi:hypothetical protein